MFSFLVSLHLFIVKIVFVFSFIDFHSSSFRLFTFFDILVGNYPAMYIINVNHGSEICNTNNWETDFKKSLFSYESFLYG